MIWLQILLFITILYRLVYISHPEHFISNFSLNKAGTEYWSFCGIFPPLMGIGSMPFFKFQEAFYDQIYLKIVLDNIYDDILS